MRESKFHRWLNTITSFSAGCLYALIIVSPKPERWEEGLELHDSKDSPMAGHKKGYWGLCLYLTGLNICPDTVYCGIQTEGR